MYIVNKQSKEKVNCTISRVEISELPSLTQAQFFFEWIEELEYEVYKLCIVDSQEILGLVSFERIPEEWRVHIRLLTVSVENLGRTKKFDRIAGNLIVHVAKVAVSEYAEMACVSLKPKSKLIKHYIDKYQMSITGTTLSIQVPEIIELIKRFDHQ